jgi:hypothetical protein
VLKQDQLLLAAEIEDLMVSVQAKFDESNGPYFAIDVLCTKRCAHLPPFFDCAHHRAHWKATVMSWDWMQRTSHISWSFHLQPLSL